MRPKTLAASMVAIIVLSVCAISAQQPAAPSPMPTLSRNGADWNGRGLDRQICHAVS
jgi:hypothetical protein